MTADLREPHDGKKKKNRTEDIIQGRTSSRKIENNERKKRREVVVIHGYIGRTGSGPWFDREISWAKIRDSLGPALEPCLTFQGRLPHLSRQAHVDKKPIR
jgi:hypothetical protein